ncbi:hypothetical protein PROFUN_14444 [Planoprotostelium fungivorum]|uniref:Uncharacterized protein n=1 Tax=Planoprotostelium fungivorum TaxID=1890364 RepID=A0A2P6MX92_9EUKA|nr:hypothetical protein PROFUN_14444 [Planoprotostelium fungivorum]
MSLQKSIKTTRSQGHIQFFGQAIYNWPKTTGPQDHIQKFQSENGTAHMSLQKSVKDHRTTGPHPEILERMVYLICFYKSR